MIGATKRLSVFVGGVATMALLAVLSAQRATTPAAGAAGATSAAVSAAQAFLSSLDADQRARAGLSYDEPKKKAWHNLPPNMSTRAGIVFHDLTLAQRELGINLLKAVLSPYGYQKIADITAADEFLGTDMGAGFPTGPNAYLLAIFGTPSLTEPWAIQYGGHHLGLNVAISGKNHVMAPTLTGAYPNIYTKDGKEIFVLHDEVDRAMKLVNSLSAENRAKAMSPTQIWDFVLGPGHDGQVIQPEGLKASAMTTDQKKMLVEVAGSWVNLMNEQSAKEKLAEITARLDDTYFLWSGDTTARGLAYFRIQGPTMLIEYSPQTVGGPGSANGRGRRGAGAGAASGVAGPGAAGATATPRGADQAARGQGGREGRGFQDLTNDPNRKLDPVHVHTVYRDFTNDYGARYAAAR